MKQHLQSKAGFIACQLSGRRAQSKSVLYGVDRRTFLMLDENDRCQHCSKFLSRFQKAVTN